MYVHVRAVTPAQLGTVLAHREAEVRVVFPVVHVMPKRGPLVNLPRDLVGIGLRVDVYLTTMSCHVGMDCHVIPGRQVYKYPTHSLLSE